MWSSPAHRKIGEVNKITQMLLASLSSQQARGGSFQTYATGLTLSESWFGGMGRDWCVYHFVMLLPSPFRPSRWQYTNTTRAGIPLLLNRKLKCSSCSEKWKGSMISCNYYSTLSVTRLGTILQGVWHCALSTHASWPDWRLSFTDSGRKL